MTYLSLPNISSGVTNAIQIDSDIFMGAVSTEKPIHL